jgi:serine/threonine protein phosphatase 1
MENGKMRIFVISDIHGQNSLFRKALKSVQLKKSDLLILLGDLIDRGENSKGVLDTVLLLREHDFQVEIVLGNHEKMFLDSFESETEHTKWMLNGGDKTLMSFLTSEIKKIPNRYIDLIKDSKYYFEILDFILVHAGLNMKIANPFDDLETILWERNPQELLNEEWLGNRRIIHGHTPLSKDTIKAQINSKILGIDNGTYLKKKDGFGSLSILELNSMEINFIDED